MAEPLTLYKLMILYMLEKSEFPLTNAQIPAYPGQRLHHLFSSPAGYLGTDRFRPY